MSTHINARDAKLNAETRRLIDEALVTRRVTECQPANLPGNETSRSTKRFIAQLRGAWRKARRAKTQ